MIDKHKFEKELLKAFIRFQFQQDRPYSLVDVCFQDMLDLYRNDAVFHNKVRCLVSGVMSIAAECEE